MAQQKTERLLELVSLLLKRRRPVPKPEIKELLPHYQRLSGPSFDRTFERDKKELRSLGVPVKVYSIETGEEIDNPAQAAKYEARELGYLIDHDEYYLPRLDLTAEEWAVISLVCAGPQFPASKGQAQALASLAQKIGCQKPEKKGSASELGLSANQQPGAAAEAKVLGRLQEAVKEGVTIRFRYHSISRDAKDQRQADPYLLIYNAGVWYLIAYCHKRKEVRTFKVSRIEELKLLNSQPRFKVPKDFDKTKHLDRKAWELGGGQAVPVTLKVNPDSGWLARRELGSQAVWDKETNRIKISVSNPAPFIRWAAANCDRARVEQPEEIARQVSARLQSVLKLYKP
ncbi:WYL domain-containing protein [candidate division TA06 bacterium]|uniref:WYL domain-containing protein n=1 Tax=candidate division TA06 bacterium TaxID=2250710 RepID=A0A933MK46_UNCT6|nr:WYL domain-containing protein [candidate division TA06 bacterium]